MRQVNHESMTSPQDDTTITEADRRRSGRAERVAPALIALLRGQVSAPDGEMPETDAPAISLATAGESEADIVYETVGEAEGALLFRGIIIASLMATPFWVLVGILIWWMTR